MWVCQDCCACQLCMIVYRLMSFFFILFMPTIIRWQIKRQNSIISNVIGILIKLTPLVGAIKFVVDGQLHPHLHGPQLKNQCVPSAIHSCIRPEGAGPETAVAVESNPIVFRAVQGEEHVLPDIGHSGGQRGGIGGLDREGISPGSGHIQRENYHYR